MTSAAGTNKNSACGSTNRLISQGQATRSTFAFARVTYFMMDQCTPTLTLPHKRGGKCELIWAAEAMGLTQGLAVETRGLTKRYSTGVLAVVDLNLQVRTGEVYGFLGPNGAGKTTTLRMLSGLLRPTSGTATVAGGSPRSPGSLARMGAIVETPPFYPYLSRRDNLRVVARYAGVPRSRIEPVLQQVDLTDRARHKFRTYSTGMKQRLGVGPGLVKATERLILDEAHRGFDPPGDVEMW